MKLAVASLGKFHAKPYGHGKAGQANVRFTNKEKGIMKKLLLACLVFIISFAIFYFFSLKEYQYFNNLYVNNDQYIGVIEKVSEAKKRKYERANITISYFIKKDGHIYDKSFEYIPTKTVSFHFFDLSFIPIHREGEQIEIITPKNNIELAYPKEYVSYQIRYFFRDIIIKCGIVQLLLLLYLFRTGRNTNKQSNESLLLYYKDMSYNEHYIKKITAMELNSSLTTNIQDDLIGKTLIAYIYRFSNNDIYITKSTMTYITQFNNDDEIYHDSKEIMIKAIQDFYERKKAEIEQLLRPDIAFVIKLAVATLGKFYAKPFGHGKAGQANVRMTPSAREEIL